jgi:DNA-directed RNA polymerase beta subunit
MSASPNGKNCNALQNTSYLNHCFEMASKALKRADHHMFAARDAMRNAGEWLAKVSPKCNKRAWRVLLKRHRIGDRMARYCMKVYDRWDEVKNFDPEMSKRKICQALVKNPRKEEFDPVAFAQSRAFTRFLKAACKGWSVEELKQLREALTDNDSVKKVVLDAMNKARRSIRKKNNKLTKDDVRQWQEHSMKLSRRLLHAELRLLLRHSPEELLEMQTQAVQKSNTQPFDPQCDLMEHESVTH